MTAADVLVHSSMDNSTRRSQHPTIVDVVLLASSSRAHDVHAGQEKD